MGRFSVVDAPPLAPGSDFLTKTTHGPFIDTGYHVPWGFRGRVYLAEETVSEMATELGLFDVPVHDEESKALHEREIYNRGYADGLKEGRELHDKLVRILERLGIAEPVPADDQLDDLAPVQESVEEPSKPAEPPADADREPEGDPEGEPKPAPKKRGTRRKASAPAPEQGPDDVPDAVGNVDRSNPFQI